ncbi:MAG: hypothetical protein ACI9UR_000970 [Bacteroidia bacterium]|jgi:hypothetical protein
MMPKLTDQQHRNLAFWGMACIAIGLPLSVFLVSIGLFVLSGNWLLEARYKERVTQFIKDPLSLISASIYLLFVVGMFWTENLDEGLKELRVKLPILLLPFLLFTSKMPSNKRLQDILMLFVVGCVIGTSLGMIHYLVENDGDILNKRKLSVVISHIRFGLMLVLAIFILIYYLTKKWKLWSLTERVLAIATAIWFFFFMVLMETATAFLAFIVLASLSLLRLFIKSSNYKLKAVVFTTMLLGAIACLIYVNAIRLNNNFEVPHNQLSLTVKTLNGNYYSHQKDVPYTENGHRVWNFVCMDELEREWPKYSDMNFADDDESGQPIKFTMIRYLSSLGVKKDSAGLNTISAADVAFIEKGYTNYKYTSKWGVSRRIAQMFWQVDAYQYHGSSNHSSLLMRWVYFKIGLDIMLNNPVLGVGTGDMRLAYRSAYDKDDRGMLPKFQDISHNQFLSVGIVVGLSGLLWFIFALLFPVGLYYKDYLYLMFIALVLTSFLTDNTLGTQSGVTLFAFFNSLLIIRKEFSDTDG